MCIGEWKGGVHTHFIMAKEIRVCLCMCVCVW